MRRFLTMKMTLLITLWALPVPAADFAFGDIREFNNEADLIFKGEVMAIEYANVFESSLRGQLSPHTFVTFAIQRVFKGAVQSHQVTLRFLGGLNEESGEVLNVSIMPQFDIGDTDILFVRDDPESICPLVQCRKSRLRVIAEKIYNEEGFAVRVDEENHFSYGSFVPSDEVLTHNIGEHVYERVSDQPGLFDSDSLDVTPLGIYAQLAPITRVLSQNHQFKKQQDQTAYEDFAEFLDKLITKEIL